jgi:NifB/MoaA-like Fe-S oxidoreductase
VVTCPAMNDGKFLEQTVMDLAGCFPNVLSIGVVPVGLTRTPQEILSSPGASCSRILPSAADLPLRTFTPEEARTVVHQTRRWQRAFRRESGCNLVYASDELYLLCDEPVPSAASYDGYPQYENGIGMVRDLVDDWKRLRRRLVRQGERPVPNVSATLLCGNMIAQSLGRLVDDWHQVTRVKAEVVTVPNRFFGPRVRVSGLLTAEDIVAGGPYDGDILILPSVMLDKTGTRLLDDVTPAELAQRLGKPVYFAGYISEVDRIVFASSTISPTRPCNLAVAALSTSLVSGCP